MEKVICKNCVLDTSIENIVFDQKGECNFCKLHWRMEQRFPIGKEGEITLNNLIKKIKAKGKGRKYDCVVGISGGVDSTYCAYLAKKWGLRVLAVHLDNGWNSEEAEHNIRMISEKLDIDIRTEKVNWEEFKKLQIAFLKASVSDIEIPTDVGIYATLFKVASEEGIKSIINGHSFRQEGSQPITWTYMDGRYIESVYKIYTGNRLKHFSNIKFWNMFYYSVVKRIKEYRPLELIEYSKKEAGEVLRKELGWEDYGGHHFESIYTRFVATYILPQKFGIDKRKVSLSAKVRDNKISREKALEELNKPIIESNRTIQDKTYVLEKLGISETEFSEIMNARIKAYMDFPNYHSLVRKFRFPIRIAGRIGLVPQTYIEKYLK